MLDKFKALLGFLREYKDRLLEKDFLEISDHLNKIRQKIYSSEYKDLDFDEMLHKIKNTFDKAEERIVIMNKIKRISC